MDVALTLLGITGAVLSALALYLASRHAHWRARLPRAALRAAGWVLAPASLAAWTTAIGFAPGLCAMLGSWMLALVLLPYLGWWTVARAAGKVSAAAPLRGSRAALETE